MNGFVKPEFKKAPKVDFDGKLTAGQRFKYKYLNGFEKAAVKLCKRLWVLSGRAKQLFLHNTDKVLAYKRGKGIFVCNLHPENSYTGYEIPVPEMGEYEVVMSTDDFCFGGFGRVYHQTYSTVNQNGKPVLQLYLPSRTAIVIQKLKIEN